MEQTFTQKLIITISAAFLAAYLIWCFNHALDGSKFTIKFTHEALESSKDEMEY